MQVLVNQSFVNAVRSMLIGLAAQGITPQNQIDTQIEHPRQYCEGYLGLQRNSLKRMNPADVAEVLKVCGFPVIE